MIPAKFHDPNQPAPRAKTVGELRALLAELPADLRVTMNHDDHVELAVYEIGTDAQHLLLDPVWDDEDDA